MRVETAKSLTELVVFIRNLEVKFEGIHVFWSHQMVGFSLFLSKLLIQILLDFCETLSMLSTPNAINCSGDNFCVAQSHGG